MNKLSFNIPKKLLINLYRTQKLSAFKIAKKLRCSTTTIIKRLKKFNIKIRTSAEYMIENKYCKTGEKHHNWKPEKHKIYYCKEKNCNNKITYQTWKYGSGRCGSCAQHYFRKIHPNYQKKNHPMLGKKHTKKSKEKMRKSLSKHHIYLKENHDKIIKLSKSKHSLLHVKAYTYIYQKYGKKGINNYLKWFDKNYDLFEGKKHD